MSNIEIIGKMQSHFDSLAQTLTEESIEFWFARDLQEPSCKNHWVMRSGKIFLPQLCVP
jgi:hypothetical protein